VSDLSSTVESDCRLVNGRLRRELRFDRDVPSRLAAAMRYAVLGPGKRVRPVLTLEAFRAAGGADLAVVLPFCAGVELIHTFSLIHDDLPSMDDDDFRRGRPSLHRKFDEATAILAADGLFAYAYELFARAPGPAERKVEAVRAISIAVGPYGMTGGQMLDIEGARRPTSQSRRAASLVLETHRKKTAEFIAASLVAGAILGGAAPSVQRGLRQAGLALGVLFQLTDDLLDANQTSETDRSTMVSTSGSERTVRRAASMATKSEKLFRSLGAAYDILAEIAGLVLNRRS
jgi:geranylgeranyl diphosphate synthase, type II